MKKGYLIVSLFIIGIWVYLLKNLHYYYIPNPDVFESLTEGEILFHHWLSWIATPPAYSLLLYIFEKILPFEHPGITGGILFNILCFTFSIIILWKQLREWLGRVVYVVLFMFILHPLSSLTNLQPMNTSPALLLILLVFYVHPRRPTLSYILMALAFFYRYDAIVLFPIIALWDLLEHKKLKKPLALLLSSIPVGIWMIRGFYEDTVYRPEYSTYGHNIPNTQFIIDAFSSILFNFAEGSMLIAVIVILWIMTGILLCYKKGVRMPLLYGMFIASYCLVHTLFPVVVPRYTYLILPYVLALLYWPAVFIPQARPRGKTILICLVISLTLGLTYRSLRYRMYQEDLQWDRADKRVAGEWLKHNVTKPTVAYAFMNDIIAYYAKNPQIEYQASYNTDELKRIVCDNKKDVLLFIDNDEIKKRYYYDYADGQDFTTLFINSEMFPYFTYIDTLTIDTYVLKIYKYEAGLQTVCKSQNPYL